MEPEAKAEAKAKRKPISRKIKCCNFHKQHDQGSPPRDHSRPKAVCPSLRLMSGGIWQFLRICASRRQGQFVTLQPVRDCFLRRRDFNNRDPRSAGMLLTEGKLCRRCQRSIAAHPDQTSPGILKLHHAGCICRPDYMTETTR